MAIATFTRPKEWIFFSKNRRHKVAAHKIQSEKRFSSGQIEVPTKVLTFEDGVFRTNRKMEADVIRDSHSCRIGKIREISEEELGRLNKARVARIKMQSSDTPRNDDNILNELADGGVPDVMEEPDVQAELPDK